MTQNLRPLLADGSIDAAPVTLQGIKFRSAFLGCIFGVI
jgi:hypothetical protein